MRNHYFVNLSDTGYSTEELEFLKAVDCYQRQHGVRQPDWTEILQLVKSLGYRKVAKPVALPAIPPTPN